MNNSPFGARDLGPDRRELAGARTIANPTLSCSTLQPCVASSSPTEVSRRSWPITATSLFPDEMFEDLFPSGRGRPSIPADVVASVMVLQALEGLSDRDAARALRDRISWKVACGLALDDEGFDFSVLTYWRTRLRKSEQPERIFDAVRSVIDATGVLKGKTRRALDSTLLDDAVATQDTVTQLIAAIRRVRRVVPGAKDVPSSAHDYESSGKPLIAWDDPVAKAALVDGLVNDALHLLAAFEDDHRGRRGHLRPRTAGPGGRPRRRTRRGRHLADRPKSGP